MYSEKAMLVGVIIKIINYAYRGKLAMLAGIRDIRDKKNILKIMIIEVNVKSKK